MPKLNLTERLGNSLTDRTIVLERVSAGSQRTIISAFRVLEDDLIRELEALSPADVSIRYQRSRLRKLLRQTRSTIALHFGGVKKRFTEDMTAIADSSVRHLVRTTQANIGADFFTVSLGRNQLKSIVNNTLIEGAPSKTWWSRQSQGLHDRFADKMRTGLLTGRTTDEIVHSMRGTRAAGFSDGVMRQTTNAMRTLVRTSSQHIANEARTEMYQENADVIKAIKWVSTLDLRTTEICLALDGLTWDVESLEPIDHDKEFPGPTAHWNCRSTQVSVFKDFETLDGGNTIKTEAGGRTNAQAIFERNAKAQGLTTGQAQTSIFNARASMDGEVGGRVTTQGWLNSKTRGQQEKLLGKERVKLFRAGRITTRQLTNQQNRPLTIRELERL